MKNGRPYPNKIHGDGVPVNETYEILFAEVQTNVGKYTGYTTTPRCKVDLRSRISYLRECELDAHCLGLRDNRWGGPVPEQFIQCSGPFVNTCSGKLFHTGCGGGATTPHGRFSG